MRQVWTEESRVPLPTDVGDDVFGIMSRKLQVSSMMTLSLIKTDFNILSFLNDSASSSRCNLPTPFRSPQNTHINEHKGKQ